ncbi:hypothetical protein BDZ45DRAFT_698341 [Acephala macrosclerotiorum]|nr:hypothetical protein BDZ45DRAFT_698341 [Acephala macrosclerotiorum]
MFRSGVILVSVLVPLLDVVEYEEYDFADAFDSQSIYRGPPVPERENAWIQLTHKIPEDKLPYLNRSHDPSDLRHVPENVGTGYIAIIEVSHQLHCLLASTQKFQDLMLSEVGNRMHVDHCIETLRIALMCWSDVTPLSLRTDPDAPLRSRADFNSHHGCRNFDKIQDWIDNNWSVY